MNLLCTETCRLTFCITLCVCLFCTGWHSDGDALGAWKHRVLGGTAAARRHFTQSEAGKSQRGHRRPRSVSLRQHTGQIISGTGNNLCDMFCVIWCLDRSATINDLSHYYCYYHVRPSVCSKYFSFEFGMPVEFNEWCMTVCQGHSHDALKVLNSYAFEVLSPPPLLIRTL